MEAKVEFIFCGQIYEIINYPETPNDLSLYLRRENEPHIFITHMERDKIIERFEDFGRLVNDVYQTCHKQGEI